MRKMDKTAKAILRGNKGIDTRNITVDIFRAKGSVRWKNHALSFACRVANHKKEKDRKIISSIDISP